jgi:hypothetical protein
MAFILKQSNKDSWLSPKIEVITQESFDALLNHVTELNKPKLIEAVNQMLLVLQDVKQDYNTSIFKHIYPTKYNYLFEFYSTDYTTKKSRVAYREIEFLEKYGTIIDKISPYAKVLKTAKLNYPTDYSHPLNPLLHTISHCLYKPSWYQNGELQGVLEDNDIDSKITQAESYALLFEDGYLDSNGYTNAHLSDAKLFSSIEVAKRSRASRGNSATIVKLNTQLQEIVLGHNEITDRLTSTLEKRRLEKMLELANIEELKKQIAEYEKNTPVVLPPKKKIKV